MRGWLSRRTRLHGDERGVALITVVGTAGVLAIFATTMVVQSINNLKQVGAERRFQQAVQAADAGIDQTLWRVNANAAYTTGEALPGGGFASIAAEEAWVLARADTASGQAGRLNRTPNGDWIAVKPPNVALVYSVGYYPSYATPSPQRRVRVLRASYAVAPVPTGYAILTRGDLELGSAHTDIKVGSVHSNGNLTMTGKGKVDGGITSTGTLTEDNDIKVGKGAPLQGGMPTITVPLVRPTDYYPTVQYVFCADGTISAGPMNPESPHNNVNNPCGGTKIAYNAASGYRGWFYRGIIGTQGGVWQYSVGKSGKNFDGTYYFHESSAWIDGGSKDKKVKDWNATIIASTSGTDCNLVGGDITVRRGTHDHWNPHANAPGLLMLAGRDFDHGRVGAAGPKENYTTGWAHSHDLNGLVYAYEHFTIGKDHFKLNGSLMSYGLACNSPGSPASTNRSGHPHIKWTATLAIPQDALRILQWEEL